MADAEVVLITGCASGIGKALARDLSRRQNQSGGQAYKVYATDYRYSPNKIAAITMNALQLLVNRDL